MRTVLLLVAMAGVAAGRPIIKTDKDGNPIHSATSPVGFGAQDIQAMYNIDPSLGDGMTVGVVDAYGYEDIEADLAVYRAQYGLPACTIASGCLTVYNNNGETSPLATDSDQGWIGETALDIQMVSAACPKCKIVVLQAASNFSGLRLGQSVLQTKDVDAISNSFSGGEDPGVLAEEPDYTPAGVGEFASTGDDGYLGGAGYPATSASVIAVGGTRFENGVTTAWSFAGSACSMYIPKPVWAPNDWICDMRAGADVSAIADPETGVAVYVAKQGGWAQFGGTSASSPILAATMAAAGHADARPSFIYAHRDAFQDVTMGANGTCGTPVCEARSGWDGPTGVGIPLQNKLVAIGNVPGAGPAVSITYPKDGAKLKKGFSIQAAPDPAAVWIDVRIDDQRVQRLGADPWTTSAPSALADGAHTITVIAYDGDHNSQTATISVTIDNTVSDDGGTCSSTRPSTALVALGLVLGLRKRRTNRANAPRG
ncbi:MAG: hypothetical protein QM831_29300 [Kofleriaceae bacterium]